MKTVTAEAHACELPDLSSLIPSFCLSPRWIASLNGQHGRTPTLAPFMGLGLTSDSSFDVIAVRIKNVGCIVSVATVLSRSVVSATV
jgi:hypothetical protein